MLKTTKKILCYTAITSILNLSFQPAYAGKTAFLLTSEEMSYTQKVSHHLTKKGLHKEGMSDLELEDPQKNSTPLSATEIDNVSWFFLTPLKTMIGAISLVKKGVRFALENPGQAITMGLLLQARAVTSTLSLSSLTPNQGFTINGAAGDHSGQSVSSAGDFNGDGLSDIIIGAPQANNNKGQSYVIYGTNSTPSLLSLSSLTPLQGFNITGARHDNSGHSVSSVGDFNGDGLSDIIIGAPEANFYAGASYVIYGTNSTPPSINLTSLTPNQGLTLYGAVADFSGFSVSSAGDFNGDGLSDVTIGALIANNGVGKSDVIYGTNSTPPSISLSSLTSNQGFTINGVAVNDLFSYSVSSAGDFNGDGLSDIIIGAPGADSETGKSYVIYGRIFDNAIFSSLIAPAPLPATESFSAPLPAPAPPPAPAPLSAVTSVPLPLSVSATPSVTSTPSTEGSEISTSTSQTASVSPTSAPVSTVSSQTSAGTSMSEFTSTNPMPSSISISSSPTSAETETRLNPPTSKVISSPFMSTPLNSHTSNQDEANEAPSQSLPHLFVGTALLIGQERF